jgi:hypothetical protein
VSANSDTTTESNETLHVFPVSTRRGHALVVLLGVIAMLLLVAGGVTMFMGAPPAIQSWMWPMIIVGAAALAGAFVRHSFRRRRLVITRSDEQHYLEVDGEGIRLPFPLGFSGDQIKNTVNRIPIYEVWLKLVDSYGRGGVFLTETRGAIYGAQTGWLTGIDRTVACERFEAGKVGMLAELLGVVKAINAQHPGNPETGLMR